MNPFDLLLVLVSESTTIAGQVFFKHAMRNRETPGVHARSLTIGVFSMAIGFFVWLALLGRHDVSYLFAFDGLNRIILVIAASIFLKERATIRIWIGVLLISAGVMIVANT